MSRVKIKWSEKIGWLKNANVSTLEYMDDNGFYAIYLGKYNSETKKVENVRLLYIGQAYDQTIRQRIQQPHDADPCINNMKKKNPNHNLFFESGIISEMDQARVTDQLFNDIECCLINKNQPECNKKCKESYEGRDIIIENEKSWKIQNSSC